MKIDVKSLCEVTNTVILELDDEGKEFLIQQGFQRVLEKGLEELEKEETEDDSRED